MISNKYDTILFSRSLFNIMVAVVCLSVCCPQGMKHMYTDCHLIHADLSEYNMLWFKGNIYFIDVGQAVESSHPHGLEFLYRDCSNVSHFFSRVWVGPEGGVKTPQELFNYVTDMNIQADSDQEFIVQVGVAETKCIIYYYNFHG